MTSAALPRLPVSFTITVILIYELGLDQIYITRYFFAVHGNIVQVMKVCERLIWGQLKKQS
jgi:hypothetical protein